MSAQYLTPKEFAQHYGVCVETVRRWIRKGEVQAEKISKRYYIKHDDAKRILRKP